VNFSSLDTLLDIGILGVVPPSRNLPPIIFIEELKATNIYKPCMLGR
jgi:hypothetical protein